MQLSCLILFWQFPVQNTKYSNSNFVIDRALHYRHACTLGIIRLAWQHEQISTDHAARHIVSTSVFAVPTDNQAPHTRYVGVAVRIQNVLPAHHAQRGQMEGLEPVWLLASHNCIPAAIHHTTLRQSAALMAYSTHSMGMLCPRP